MSNKEHDDYIDHLRDLLVECQDTNNSMYLKVEEYDEIILTSDYPSILENQLNYVDSIDSGFSGSIDITRPTIH